MSSRRVCFNLQVRWDFPAVYLVDFWFSSAGVQERTLHGFVCLNSLGEWTAQNVVCRGARSTRAWEVRSLWMGEAVYRCPSYPADLMCYWLHKVRTDSLLAGSDHFWRGCGFICVAAQVGFRLTCPDTEAHARLFPLGASISLSLCGGLFTPDCPLKSLPPETEMARPASFWSVSAWHVCLHPFTFNPDMSPIQGGILVENTQLVVALDPFWLSLVLISTFGPLTFIVMFIQLH